ncbi:response regulator transcription factor [Aureibacter tunicatorum]|uniref:DNA-binding response OmpR family regulator n=1 Tax=Aureibacter tunicatorum TaxID=866807 RepID=A0AAE3XL52_9BACT|nr:response regulator transcription factor [Aureibacter tunicatorum]MDR6238013.1 DNA-binding response OmpR family regulator [Aureibacter tunicatorum]BDD03046.1 DNA-binding response regulator [Aureibacter tunicatorum]
MKILIVEDNEKLILELETFLHEEGFLCEKAENVAKALEKVSIYSYDLIVLDIGLPDGSGLDVLKRVKEVDPDTGILILSAKNSIDDKIVGLDLGADDYITKPFHKAELNARVRSILRRKKFEGNNVMTINEIMLDIQSKEVKINGEVLKLTPKEYELLLYFIYNRKRVLTKESIAEHLWEDNIDLADSFDFIYSHIKNLRKKMLKAGCADYIRSVYGVGYKFDLDR